MSSLTGLSKRQVQVLWAVNRLWDLKLPSTGHNLVSMFQNSTIETSAPGREGIHQTAASLVRRKLIARGYTGTHTVAYSPLPAGHAVLQREVEVHGRPL